MSGRYTPQATITDVNAILGRGRKPLTVETGAVVYGVNPRKITCDEIVVSQSLSLLGTVTMPFTHFGGTVSVPTIRFTPGPTTGCGIYSPAANDIRVAINGSDAGIFSNSGFGTSVMFSPTGIIDFSGSTLINIGSITTNPRSYDIVGVPVTTMNNAPFNILTIPITPLPAHAGTWEIQPKILYTEVGTGGASSGCYTFRVRVSLAAAPGVPIVTGQYDITEYDDPALVGITCTINAVMNAIQVIVTGQPLVSIVWQAKASIVTVES